jgi:hypothetical protein
VLAGCGSGGPGSRVGFRRSCTARTSQSGRPDTLECGGGPNNSPEAARLLPRLLLEGLVAMSTGRDSHTSGRCKVLPRATTRSSLAWDRRRGATCVLEVIRQIVHAPARDERRTCGPYQKGTRCGAVKRTGPIRLGSPERGMAEPPHCRRRQQRSRRSSTSRDRHPRRRQRWHAGKVM